MPPVGFEPTISAGERPQTYALDRAGAGTGHFLKYVQDILFMTYLFTSLLARHYMSVFTEFQTMSKSYVALAEQDV